MFLSRRRLVLIGISAIVGGIIVLLPLILTITLPDLNKVNISLQRIDYQGAIENNNTAMLNIFFNVHNPTSQALTTSKIDFSLFANGISLGNHTIEYLDTPLNGRPQLLANRDSIVHEVINAQVPDKNLFVNLKNNNQTMQKINWKVDGTAIIESGFSESPKQFTSSW
jgi:hypothetical protein